MSHSTPALVMLSLVSTMAVCTSSWEYNAKVLGQSATMKQDIVMECPGACVGYTSEEIDKAVKDLIGDIEVPGVKISVWTGLNYCAATDSAESCKALCKTDCEAKTGTYPVKYLTSIAGKEESYDSAPLSFTHICPQGQGKYATNKIKKGLSAGAIAGIVIAVIVVVGLAIGLTVFFVMKKQGKCLSKKQKQQMSQPTTVIQGQHMMQPQ